LTRLHHGATMSESRMGRQQGTPGEMNVFFTADLHLGHDNIRRHCRRPDQDLRQGLRDRLWVEGEPQLLRVGVPGTATAGAENPLVHPRL
jgi:hypothetical protein